MRAKLPTVIIALLLTLVVVIIILHNGQEDERFVEAHDRQRRGDCDPNMCQHLQDKYFDEYSCSCKGCCYSTALQIANNDIVGECRQKNHKCIDHPRYSACSRNGAEGPFAQCPSEQSPTEEPSCKEGCHEVHGYCNVTGDCSCHTGWQGDLCNECIRTLGCLHGICKFPGQCLCYQGWKGPLCDKANVTTLPPVLPISSLPPSLLPSKKNTSSKYQTSDPTGTPIWGPIQGDDVPAIIVGVAVGSVVVVVVACCLGWYFCKKCGKSKDSSSSSGESSQTSSQVPTCHEQERLLEGPKDKEIQAEERTASKDNAVPVKSGPSLQTDTLEMRDLITSDGVHVDSFNESKDSAYFSLTASPQQPLNTPTASLPSVISKFAWKCISELHTELKAYCVSTGDWEKALQAEAVNGYQIKLNGITAGDLTAYPACIIKAFTAMPYGAQSEGVEDVVPLLHMIKMCQRFHHSANTQFKEFNQAVEKVISIMSTTEMGKHEAVLNSGRPEMLSLLSKLQKHPDFPKNIVEPASDMAGDKRSEQKPLFNPDQMTEAFSKLQSEVKSHGGRLKKLEQKNDPQPQGPEDPVVKCIPLFGMICAIIDRKLEGYKSRCRFQLVCNQKCCTTYDSMDLTSTPMAHSVLNLRRNHSYTFIAKFGMLEQRYDVTTLKMKCSKTLGDLCWSQEDINKLSIQCDRKSCDIFRRRLAGLLQCKELERIEYYKEYETRLVICMLLEKQSEFPVSVLTYCLQYCGMYEAIHELSAWHERCDVCGPLFREAQTKLHGDRL